MLFHMKLTIVQWLLAGLLCTAVEAYSNPGSCTGACNVHDPAIVQRADGTYFWFSTGGGIAFSKSSSISGPWSSQGNVLPGGSSVQQTGNTDLWAPDVQLIGGTYYMFYAVSTFGSQTSTIGVASSPNMEAGTWTDHGSTGVFSRSGSPYNAIDPNWITIGGKSYLNYGSFWNDIYQVPMSSPLKAASASPYNIEYNSTGSRPCEGSFMYEYSGYYYLFWSSGICCNYDKSKPAPGEEYKIMMCRSSTGTGNFVDKNGVSCLKNGGSILLASHNNVYGPGGQGIFNDNKLGPVLYYHYANLNVGLGDGQYLLGWNRLTWSNGWPSV